ncbi:terpene synthase family protein [Streptomyces sp. NPDC127068]|uniref:terpene synthase family protein n=1 Tax=Streptomyces sp. NPDC127068 TaxID=3347127 RepID=UPI0036634FC9
MSEPSTPDGSLPFPAEILYPRTWTKVPSDGLAERLESSAFAWLEHRGLLYQPENRRNIAACHLGDAVARSNPTARSTTRLEFHAKFLGMWFLYEDSIEGIGTQGHDPRLVSRALTGFWQGPVPSGPLWHWAELGEEMATSMSPSWRRRFGARFEAWQYSIADEAALFKTSGMEASLDAYVAVRLHTLGMCTATDMIEYTQGRELPPEVFADPDIMEIYRIISTAGLIDNDLYCLTKDREHRYPNLVYVLARERGLTETQSIQSILVWHDRLVERFTQVERRLRKERAELGVSWWLECVQHMATGLGAWHHDAPRYRTKHLTREGRMIHVRISLW